MQLIDFLLITGETVATTTYFINTLVSSLSKADRVTHKNTKTFIQSWLENHASKTTSLKTNNYDLVTVVTVVISVVNVVIVVIVSKTSVN